MVSPTTTTLYWLVATNIYGCGQTLSFTVVVSTCSSPLTIVALLEGAYNTTTGLQRTTLQQPLVPAIEPYTALGYTFKGGGGETTNVPANLQSKIVDWVIIELRNATTPTLTSYSRAALLLDDGRIVDIDGVSDPSVSGRSTNSYHVVVIHRNHLGVMSATPVTLRTMVDFSSPQTAVFGTSVQRLNVNGKALLFSGDADGNGQIQNTDDVMQWMPNAGTSGYKAADYNMDGQVQNTDRVFIWRQNVGRGSAVPK